MQEELKGIAEGISGKAGSSESEEAKRRLEGLLRNQDICGLNPSVYYERKLIGFITEHFQRIASAKDFSRVLEEQLEEERKPIIIRPSGFVIGD